MMMMMMMTIEQQNKTNTSDENAEPANFHSLLLAG